jgi:hypothetical protein
MPFLLLFSLLEDRMAATERLRIDMTLGLDIVVSKFSAVGSALLAAVAPIVVALVDIARGRRGLSSMFAVSCDIAPTVKAICELSVFFTVLLPTAFVASASPLMTMVVLVLLGIRKALCLFVFNPRPSPLFLELLSGCAKR